MRGSSPALEKLASAASFHDTLEDFLSSLCIGEEADVRRRSGKARASGAVTLMTLHASKGLEFPVVFLAGASEGVLPQARADCSPEAVQEERRLFFVGMTRAMDLLILSGHGELSRFVAEAGKDLACERIRSRMRAPKAEQLSMF